MRWILSTLCVVFLFAATALGDDPAVLLVCHGTRAANADESQRITPASMVSTMVGSDWLTLPPSGTTRDCHD